MTWVQPLSTWTPARVEVLTRLRAEGFSASYIGKVLGVSRNAAIGKCFRLGLAPVSKPDTGRAPRKVTPRRTPKVRLVIAGGNAIIQVPQAPPSPYIQKEAAFDVLPGTSPRPWEERTSEMCSWPIGDGLSCCDKVEAFGWCSAHRRLGRVPPKKGDNLVRALRRYA